MIDFPDAIAHLGNREFDVYSLFQDKVFETVGYAMSIIDKVNPVLTTRSDDEWNGAYDYWNSLEYIEYDMGKLSSLYAYVAALHAKLRNDVRRALTALKVYRAKKRMVIKQSLVDGIRPRVKMTREDFDAELTADDQLSEAEDRVSTAQESADLMEAALESILNHINVLKKRRETLGEERKISGNQLT